MDSSTPLGSLRAVGGRNAHLQIKADRSKIVDSNIATAVGTGFGVCSEVPAAVSTLSVGPLAFGATVGNEC